MRQLSQATILVVDEDVESLLSMASILLAQEHCVTTAGDAAQAIELAQGNPLDLLITNTRLGRWSGQELIGTIRQDPDHGDLPVMFVSEHQTPGVIRRSYDSGDAFHLKKPVEAQVLTELVASALWMPHLVKNHIHRQKVKQPHATFAPFPAVDMGANSNLPGTPIVF